VIATSTFVYIHTSRHAGQFIAPLLRMLPGAVDVGYHYPLRRLPRRYQALPVIGFVRNPWDFYVSLFHDYRRKQQYVFQLISEAGTLDFKATIKRFLTLGEAQNRRLLERLRQRAPLMVNRWSAPFLRREPTRIAAGIERRDLAAFPDAGYYSWLLRRMHDRDGHLAGLFGRFEDLKSELLRLMAETQTTVPEPMRRSLLETPPKNVSPREAGYRQYFDAELRQLVAIKDHYVIDRFGYEF